MTTRHLPLHASASPPESGAYSVRESDCKVAFIGWNNQDMQAEFGHEGHQRTQQRDPVAE